MRRKSFFSICTVVIGLMTLSAAKTFSQDQSTFHIKSVHKETPDEHGTDTGSGIRYLKIVGTFNGKTYTVEVIDAGSTEVLEVGKDYPATLKKNSITVKSTYNGRPEKIHCQVLKVEE
jgi:hypothetical protein